MRFEQSMCKNQTICLNLYETETKSFRFLSQTDAKYTKYNNGSKYFGSMKGVKGCFLAFKIISRMITLHIIINSRSICR